MAMAPKLVAPLSRAAASRINWEPILDEIGLVAGQVRSTKRRPEESDAQSGREVEGRRESLLLSLAHLKEEFENTLGWLRRIMRVVIALVVGAVALTVAGAALLQVTPYAGLLSIAGIGSLLGLLTKAWRIARDQAMLELVPARYTLAIELARSDEDIQKIIADFLAETSSLRGS